MVIRIIEAVSKVIQGWGRGGGLVDSLLLRRSEHSSVCTLKPSCLGSNLGVSKIFSDIFLSLLDVAELIDSKDRAIKINKLMEPIQYWKDQYCIKKKIKLTNLAKFFSFDSMATHILEKVGIFESLKNAAVEPPLTHPYLMTCCFDKSSADSIGDTIRSTVRNAAYARIQRI